MKKIDIIDIIKTSSMIILIGIVVIVGIVIGVGKLLYMIATERDVL
jgi:hypothetical protein